MNKKILYVVKMESFDMKRTEEILALNQEDAEQRAKRLNPTATIIQVTEAKRYYCSCVEQMVLNPDFLGYRSFRVEIFDRQGRQDGYATDEASFLVPEDIFETLYELFDGKEFDLLPQIYWKKIEQQKTTNEQQENFYR